MTDLPRPFSLANDDGVLLAVVFQALIYVYAVYQNWGWYTHHWAQFFSNRKASGGENSGDNARTITLSAAMIVVLSISCGVILKSDAFLAASSNMLLYIFAKLLLYQFVNRVFFLPEVSQRWFSVCSFLLCMLALVVFPLSLLMVFAYLDYKITYFVLFSVIILYKILVFLKFYITFPLKNYGFLLLFLYFCTFEILPILIWWHYIS